MLICVFTRLLSLKSAENDSVGVGRNAIALTEGGCEIKTKKNTMLSADNEKTLQTRELIMIERSFHEKK